MLSWLPSIVILGTLALGALLLAISRGSPPDKAPQRIAAANALVLAVGAQAIHFTEELATGFHEQLPAVFGLPALPLDAFVTFNLAWLAIWAISVPGIRSRYTAAFFAAWFLAIAGMVNAIAHPLLALRSNAYFPGLVSSVVVGAACFWLWLKLRSATTP